MKIHLLKLLVMIAAVLGLAHTAVAQTATWSGASGTDLNWSTAGNWTAAGGGSAPPAATDTVIFGNGPWPAATNAQGLVDNIVTANTTIGGLTYNNQSSTLNYFHTTQINAGATLTVNGLFSVGLASQTCTDTMTGTGNFTVNNIAGNFNVGGAGITTATVTFTLADGMNTINANTLSLGESASNNGRQCIINLGAGTNSINANTINMGTGKGLGNITWLAGTTTGTLTIRNAAGTGRATMLLGNGTSGSGGSRGNLLLAGHPADVLAGTMTIGRVGNDTANQIGVVTYDNGILDATSILMGVVPATGVPTGGGASTGNTLNVGGNPATNATLIVNSPSGPGGGGFILSDSVNTSAHVASATFNINQNGSAQVYCPIAKAQATLNTATINITGGMLNMESAANTIGTPAVPIDNLTLDTATLQFSEDGSALNAAVVNLTMNNATNVVNIAALPPIVSLPTKIPIMTYTPPLGGSFNMGVSNMPGDYQGYVTNDGVGTIYLVITSGTVVVAKQDRWSGAVNTNWDISTLNWTNAGVAVAYSEGDFVTFDDKAVTGNVTLVGNQHTPSSVTITNNVLNYTFSGPGRIFGSTSLVKWGTASLTMTESGGDSFAGGIIVHGGTLVLDNPNSVIPGGLTNDSGTVVQIGNNDGNGVLPSGNLDIEGTLVFKRTNNVVVSAVIAGGGGLTQSGSGTLTLNAANAYTGPTTVSTGTLALGASGTIASSLTTVKNATLDITPATSVSLGTVSLSNGTFNVGAGANSPGLSALSTSNSVITVIANYNNVGGSAIFTAGSLTTGGSTNVINVTAIQNLPLSPSVPFNIPLISYSSATFNGGFNFGWTNLPGISGYITNNAANNSVDLVVVSAPQNLTWDGGSSTGSFWNDAANWTGTAIAPLDALTFDGSTRLNNTNNTTAGTTYVGITFNGGAGLFTLYGNAVNLTGTMVNNSANVQTVNLGLAVNSAATLDGGGSGGSLAINGGVTNTSVSGQTVTLLGTGTIGDRLGTSTGGQIELSVGGSGADWTMLDGTGSSTLVQATNAQLNVTLGQFDFGTNGSAPNLDLGFPTNGSVTINGGAGGTFNMNNGTLRAGAMTVASSGTVAGIFNMNGGTMLLGNGSFAATGGNGASTLTATITNGSIYSTNGGNFIIAQRGAGTVTLIGGLLQCGTLVPATGQTAGGNGFVNLNGGTLICTNISVGSSGANAWGLVNFNGGILKPGASSAAFFTRLNLASLTNSVQVGGAVIDTAGFSTALNLPLVSDPTTDPNQGGTPPDGGLTKLGAGTLTLSSANTYNGNTAVGGGTLLVSGSILNTSGVTVSNNATLGGNGVIGSNVVVNAGGTLSPGNNAIGTLAVNGNVSLGGTNLMEVDKVAATKDLLLATNATATTITYGGTLKVVTLAGTIVATDTFKLFSATNYAGAFTTISPATPGTGLGWNTNTLTTDGTLRVVVTVNTNPTNITTSVSGNTLTLSWPADHTGWKLQVQTNALNKGLGTNWVDVPGSTSVNSTNITIIPANGSVFYRMTYP